MFSQDNSHTAEAVRLADIVREHWGKEAEALAPQGSRPRSLKAVESVIITRIEVVGGRLQVRYRVKDAAGRRRSRDLCRSDRHGQIGREGFAASGHCDRSRTA